jgi:hypothetical protein
MDRRRFLALFAAGALAGCGNDTGEPTLTADDTPVASPTRDPTETPTETPTERPSPTPKQTASPTPTQTASPTASPTPTDTPTPTESPTPTATPAPELPEMIDAQLVTEWESPGDLEANAIEAVGRGDRAVLAFEFSMRPHSGEVDIRAQIIVEDESGAIVDSVTEHQSRLVDSDGPVTLEWAYVTSSSEWSTGSYTAEVLVQDETSGETSDAVTHDFEIVEPLGIGEAEVYRATPDSVHEGESFDAELGLRNTSGRDSSIVSDISHRTGQNEAWQTFQSDAVVLAIPGNDGEVTWTSSRWSLSGTGGHQFRIDAIGDDWVLNVESGTPE